VIRVCQIVLNPFTHDSRVLRASLLAHEMGAEVTVLALHEAGLPEREEVSGVHVLRCRITTRSWPRYAAVRLIKYAEACLRMIRIGQRVQPSLVHANDVSALPIGLAIARITGAKLLYDAHEYWADPAHRITLPRWVFSLLVAVERLLARHADRLITVSESIARCMNANLGDKAVQVVRNTPLPWAIHPGEFRLRQALGIPAKRPLVLYQGVMETSYGVKLLLEAFRAVPSSASLVYLGDGPALHELRALAVDFGLAGRVYFHPKVPANELRCYTPDADIGVCATLPSCQNHQFALPNKLFEYIQGGLAVVVPDLQEMAGLIRQHGAGIVFTAGSADSLAAALTELISDAEALERLRVASRAAAHLLHWKHECKALARIYRELAPFGSEQACANTAGTWTGQTLPGNGV